MKNLDAFMGVEIPKVILFTKRKSTPPVLKVLSKAYKDIVSFGEVRQSDEATFEHFGISEAPKIIGITGNGSIVEYEGGNKRSDMEPWVKEFIETNKVASSGIRELTHLMHGSGSCNKNDSTPCLLWFIKRGEDTSILDTVTPDFLNDPIKFYWVDVEKYADFAAQFGGNSIVILRGKRKKYLPFESEVTASNL